MSAKVISIEIEGKAVRAMVHDGELWFAASGVLPMLSQPSDQKHTEEILVRTRAIMKLLPVLAEMVGLAGGTGRHPYRQAYLNKGEADL